MADQSPLYKDESFTVEPAGIEYISEEQRHGGSTNQFTVRFAPNIQLGCIVLGAVAIPLGLGLTGSITAILAGNLLGSICTAACTVMGPRLGMPQTAIGRVSFGYRGNYAPAVLSSLLYIGYFTVGTILGAKSLASLFHVPYSLMVIVVAGLSTLLATFGYNLVHDFGRWVTRLSGVVLLVVTIWVLVHGMGASAHGRLSGKDYWLAWLLEFTVVFSFSMSWAPYASDYSRYLPKNIDLKKVFGASFAGLLIATTWMMILGAMLMTIDLKGGVLSAMGVVLPSLLLKLVLITFGIVAIPHNAVNLYSCAMSSLTWDLPMKRSSTAVLAGVVGCVLALFLGGAKFQQNYNNFLFLVSYYVMPWLAIVCVDFFYKHRGGHGYPSAGAFYSKDGPLGGIKWPGLSAFVIGIVVSIPFMATNLFTGPIGHALDGADLSYFVSFVVAGVIYFAASRTATRTVPAADTVTSTG
jgi:NCS1 family nucleobase:cation symporter-1